MPALGWGEVLGALRDGPSDGDADRLMAEALMLGHDIATGTVGCSVTELTGSDYRTPAASNDLALTLDQAQYAGSAGPCINAARHQAPERIDALAEERRFPTFVAAALQHGVRSSLSVPLGATDRPMALNLYADVAAAYATDRARAVATLLSRMIAALAAPAQVEAGPAAAEVGDARRRGDRVSRAVDRLMRRHGMDRSAAFAVLVERSRARQQGVSAIAGELLADDADGVPADGVDGHDGEGSDQ